MLKSNFRWIAIRAALALLMIFLLQACGNNHSTEQKNVSVTQIPTAVQKLILPNGTLTAWVTVDGGSRTQMTIDSTAGTASATISGLTLATHTVLIEYEFTDTYGTILVASASKPVDLSSGSGSLNFSDADYNTSYDSDGDGITNAAELASGSNPFGQPPFSASCFPYTLSTGSSFGNLVINYDGNLLIVNGTNNILLMDHTTCNVTTVATISGELIRSVVENKIRNRLYAAGNDAIYEVNPDDGSSSILLNTGNWINTMLIAPSGFGAYSGQLIVGTGNGDVAAIDQTATSPALFSIASLPGGAVANMVFGADGALYAADHEAGKVVTVAANGTVSDYTVAPVGPDGLAIDNIGSRLFISDDIADELYSADISSANLSPLGSANFSPGWAPSGLAYAGDNAVLVLTDLQIQRHPASIPPFNTSCLPLAVAGATLGVGKYTSYRGGDMLFTSYNTDEIRVLNSDTCVVSTIASTVSASSLLGVTYDSTLNMIYAGSTNFNIYAVNPSSGISSLLTTTANEVNSLVVAPSGYGSFGGQLIAALGDGGIYAIDQTQASPTPVLIADIGGAAADLVFGADGTLYVADHDGASIVTLAADGTTAIFASGLSGPDGLAIDNVGARLFVANSGDDTLKQVTIPGGAVTVLTAADFDSGFYPSGIFYDQVGTVLMGLGETSHTITAFALSP